MKKILAIGWTVSLLTLSAARVSAAPPAPLVAPDVTAGVMAPGCEAPAAPCAVDRLKLHADIQMEEYPVEVPDLKHYRACIKETVKDVPYKHMVPVCVPEPGSCCQHVEMKEETIQLHNRCLSIEVVPVPCHTKTEIRVRACTTVTADRVPFVDAPPAPACDAAPAPFCPHCH